MRRSHLIRRGKATRLDASTLFRRLRLATAIVFCLTAFGSASESTPAVQEHLYTVNAKVRLIPLVWIGRDNIGGARITRRQDVSGRRTVEFLVGSDPVRAPRGINRWGFIMESVNPHNAEVLGAMKESNEERSRRPKRRAPDKIMSPVHSKPFEVRSLEAMRWAER